MTPHALAVEEGTPSPSGIVLKAWCCCDFGFVAVAATTRKAKRKIRCKFRDHRGLMAAAGPGRAE